MAIPLPPTIHSLLSVGLLLAAFPRSPHERVAPVTPKAAMSEPSLSPDGREIAFVSGGDIWTVPAGGGEARLLVSHPAYDSRPLYSPDGTKLAFMSTRTGNGDIYVMTLATGRLDRLTFDDVPEQLDAWSRDGKWIYFSSGSQDVNGMNDIFRVSSSGGTPIAVSADRFTQEYWAAPSPTDPNTIAFTGTGMTVDQWWRKGHAHIDESQIWLLHFGGESPRYEAVTKDDAKDAWPMWSADAKSLFYVSDKSGAENIWTAAPSGGGAKPVTSFTNGRLLWPTISYDGKTILFERELGVWSLDVASGRTTHVPITLHGAAASPGVEHQSLSQGFQSLVLSPDGKKIAFVAHGDVFAASARDGGDAARVTDTPEAETQLAWAPDSRRIAYVSSRDGAAHIFVYDFAARAESKLTDGPANDVDPTWSPDGKSIAFTRGAKQLRVADVATKQERVVATGQLGRPPFLAERAMVWSPDGRWIAYLNSDTSQFQNPYIASVNGGGGKPVAFIADGFGNSLAWSPDGTYLLFDTSQRTEQAAVARVDLVPRTPRFREDQFRELFTPAPTRPGTPMQPAPQQLPPQRDTATVRADSARSAAKKATEIVFDDIRRRISFLPVGVDVRSVVISPDGKTALFTAAAAGQLNLYTFSLDELSSEPAVARQLTSTPGGKQDAQFSPDGKEVYFLQNGRINAINVESRVARPINVTAEVDVDFAREKLAVFHQAWSILADNFFDAHMNGADWPGLEREYEPYVAGAQTTEELRRLMKLMIGELNSSHSGFNGPSFSPQPNVGRLGVRFDRTAYEQTGHLVVNEVLDLSPAALAGIKPGDFILSVDGVTIDGHVNLDSLLMYKTNRRVELSVSRAAGANVRTVAVRPVSLATERGLVYRDWVESRRAYVEKVSGGKLGYVHMQDMGAGSLQQLYIDLDTKNRGKEGVVVDIRNNNGGFVNPYAIDVLARRGYLQFTPRDFGTAPGRSVVGQRSLERPTVLVTNMHSLSDAEDFTEGYRALKLGPVVGEPTAGWIIFTSNVPLLDGSSVVRMPFERITDANGKDMELHPRPVDVLIQRPVGESYTGRDSQLDAAVKALLEKVGVKP